MLDLSLELTGASGGACSSVDAAMKQFTKAEYLEQVSKPNPNPHPKTLILTLILTLVPTLILTLTLTPTRCLVGSSPRRRGTARRRGATGGGWAPTCYPCACGNRELEAVAVAIAGRVWMYKSGSRPLGNRVKHP